VNGLNLRAGRRTPIYFDQWGNLIDAFSNTPQPDSYLRLMPRRTDVLLVDQDGNAVTGATVDLYPDQSGGTYQKVYAARPDRSLPTDARGAVSLPGDLFDTLPSASSPPKSQVLILGVRTSRARGYAFLPLYELNLLYFRTGRERGEMTLRVKLHPW
jgi:hypothetical protein